MTIHSAMLITDWLMWIVVTTVVASLLWAQRNPQLRVPWQQICQRKVGIIALVILSCYVTVGLLDCIHLRITQNHSSQVISILDLALGPVARYQEKTYSKPLATDLYYTHRSVRLQHGGTLLKNPLTERSRDIIVRIAIGLIIGIISFALLAGLLTLRLAKKHQQRLVDQWQSILKGETATAWREALLTFAVIWLTICVAAPLASHYHLLGTDKIGQDVLYQTLKSIRTGLIIGTLTTLIMLPFALTLGINAGYFGGWIDDIIQYIYTTLSSIPGVLLISATILVLQVYINNHPNLFPTLLQRADARLLALCIILGITSWANLCRLLRGETLKLRELDFITAAKSLGVSHQKILWRHIAPNVMPIIIITLVLDFSNLVLAEAVLSYIGVGVDPTTMSWGNMINSARLELAREPIVWWPLLAALVAMFLLVLAANLLADTVRDAFDPKLRQ